MTLEQLASLVELPVAIAALVVLVWLVVRVLDFIREERKAVGEQLATQQAGFLAALGDLDARRTESLDANTSVLSELGGAVRELNATMRAWHNAASRG